MHTSYTVGITTGEYKALQYVMVDQKEWIENAIKNRARIASDEIPVSASIVFTTNLLVIRSSTHL